MGLGSGTTSGFQQLGLPDPAQLAVRILASRRLGPRMKAGLMLYLEGLGARQCARAVGLRDHMSLHRAAIRHGLREIHNERRELRGTVRKLVQAQELMQRPRGGPNSTLRAFGLSMEALRSLEAGRGVL